MRFTLPKVNAGAFARGLAIRQTKRRIVGYLDDRKIGPVQLQKMIANSIGLSQIIPAQEQAEMKKYRNLAHLLEPWDIASLLPDWAVNEVNKAGTKGKAWTDSQTAWLRGIIGGGRAEAE